MKLLIAIVALFASANACLFGNCKWDTLKVTWSPNPFSHWAFDTMPRNVHANAMGFTMKDSYCNGNQPKGPFAGIRYWKGNDPAVLLIFDVNGIIAGIQTAVPQSQWPSGPPANQQGHPYVLDSGYWVLTAYFVPVNQICNGGRTAAQLQSQGTGVGLWIQNGTDPMHNLMNIPKQEHDMQQTSWTFGHCFYTMGNHYWYNVTADMPCSNFFPACTLYNKGGLNAFCWGMNGQFSSPRYEHPTTSVLNHFIKPVPNCMGHASGYTHYSTMHVYFSSQLTDLC